MTSLLWACYRGSGNGKVLSTDASLVKMEVNGEIDDYRFLSQWQWMSVKERNQFKENAGERGY